MFTTKLIFQSQYVMQSGLYACIFKVMQTQDFLGACCLFARHYTTMAVYGLAKAGSVQYPFWEIHIAKSLH